MANENYRLNVQENRSTVEAGGLTEGGGDDLSMGVVSDGQLLRRVGNELIGVNQGNVNVLSDLTDVTSADLTENNILISDGTSYISRQIVESDISDLQDYLTNLNTSQITELVDVNVINPNNGEFLVYDNIENSWKNTVIDFGGAQDSTTTIYVSKEGSDSFSGLTISNTKLTLAGAKSALDTLQISSDHIVKIEILDSGVYEEDLTLDINQHLLAKDATLIGSLTIKDGCYINLNRHFAGANNSICLIGEGDGHSRYESTVIGAKGPENILYVGTTACKANTGHTLNITVCDIIVEDIGISVSSGAEINAYLNSIYLASDGAIGVSNINANALINLFCGKIIKKENDPVFINTFGIKLNADDSTINAFVGEINADTAATSNGTNGVLYLSCNNTTGFLGGTIVRNGVITQINSLGSIVSSFDSGSSNVAGDDARGNWSVDFQTFRTASDKIAAGPRSVLIGGIDNKIESTSINGGIFAGDENIVGDNNSVILGGAVNKILRDVDPASRAGILGGTENEIHESNDSVILGGVRNRIEGNSTKSIILGGADNVISSGATESIAAGDAVSITHIGAKLFADASDIAFPSIANNEFAIQAPHLRLDDGNQQAGFVLTCDAAGSGTWQQPPVSKVFYPTDYGAAADGSVDDTDALTAVLAAASSQVDNLNLGLPYDENAISAFIEVDLNGGTYLISDTLYIGSSIHIKNGSFKTNGAMADANNFMMIINGNAVQLSNINFNGGNSTTTHANGLKVNGYNTTLNNVQIVHYKDYGIHLDNASAETKIDNCFVSKWQYNLNGPHGDETQNTGIGLYVETAVGATAGRNLRVSDSIFQYGLYPIKVEPGGGMFINCRVSAYIDQTAPTLSPHCVYIDGITQGIGLVSFYGCEFVGGEVVIDSNDDYDFRKQFIGCKFISYGNNHHDYSLRLKTTGSDVKCKGLIVQGCEFELDGASPTQHLLFDTSGGGTFAPEENLQISWIGNIDLATGENAFLNAHFGKDAIIKNSILKDANNTFSPLYFGATADGSTDDTEFIQAAIDAAEAVTDLTAQGANYVGSAYAKVDLGGKKYAITDTLIINKAIIFENGTLIATQQMAGVTDASNFMLKLETASRFATVRNVTLDGGVVGSDHTTGTSCYANLILSRSKKNTFNKIIGIHFDDYGIRLESSGFQTCFDCVIKKWDEQDTAAYADDTYYTGTAFFCGSDCVFIDCLAEFCSIGFELASGNNKLIGCQTVLSKNTGNEPSFNTGVPAESVHLSGFANNRMIGCRFAGGVIKITGNPNQIISNCNFDIGNNTQAIIVEIENEVDFIVGGLSVSGCNFDETLTPIEFVVTGTGNFVSDSEKGIHWFGNSFRSSGETAWVDAKFGAGSLVINDNSVTGTASFTNSTNNINLTGVGSLTGLAVGDVIEVTGSTSNNQLFTVEEITDADNIIVNQAHAGGTTLKSLNDEPSAASVTVAIHCKAKDAPLGYGQGWVSYSSGSGDRAHAVTYTNSTGRPISILINKSTQGLSTVQIDGTSVTSWRADGATNLRVPVTFSVPPGSTYLITSTGYDVWSELR